jgi:DNA uptake protein ComE-like DNA-binding protein
MNKTVAAILTAGVCSLGAYWTIPAASVVVGQSVLASSQAQTVDFPLNVNTASDAQLLSIPGVGQRMLREFKEYRPYVNVEQFRREIGKYVDDKQVNTWLEYVFVPTNPNTATQAQLTALKGVDAAKAQYIVANRPYQDWAALRDTLLKRFDTKTVASFERYWVFK